MSFISCVVVCIVLSCVLAFEIKTFPPVNIFGSVNLPNNPQICKFINEKQKPADCAMEFIEHSLVRSFISSSSVVLELGARYGSTSCVIAQKLNNSGFAVSVEIDPHVLNSFQANRQYHNCNVYLIHGAVGRKNVKLFGHGYGVKGLPNDSAHPNPNGVVVPSISFTSVRNLFKTQYFQRDIDTLLIDCEGCIQFLFDIPDTLIPLSDPWITVLSSQLTGINTIILEADMIVGHCKYGCVDYNMWLSALSVIGLRVVHQVRDDRFSWILHYVIKRVG